METQDNVYKGLAGLLSILALALIIYVGILSYNSVKEGRYIGRPDTERDTISISGEGKVVAVPDIGQITVSIVTEAKDAQTAQEQNVTQFNKLTEALKAAGIDSKDLKTSNYNVYPRYNYFDGERTLDGYEVSQSLEVKIRDLDNSGDIITIASQNGVNQVSGLSFTIDDPVELEKEARGLALEQAKEKAEELADLAGVNLGKIVSFSENVSGGDQPVYRNYALNEVGIGGGGAVPAPEFEAGSQDIVVYVTVQYEIY